eukprot:11177142-Lingulodinium_polyedra.AAC.1
MDLVARSVRGGRRICALFHIAPSPCVCMRLPVAVWAIAQATLRRCLRVAEHHCIQAPFSRWPRA